MQRYSSLPSNIVIPKSSQQMGWIVHLQTGQKCTFSSIVMKLHPIPQDPGVRSRARSIAQELLMNTYVKSMNAFFNGKKQVTKVDFLGTRLFGLWEDFRSRLFLWKKSRLGPESWEEIVDFCPKVDFSESRLFRVMGHGTALDSALGWRLRIICDVFATSQYQATYYMRELALVRRHSYFVRVPSCNFFLFFQKWIWSAVIFAESATRAQWRT